MTDQLVSVGHCGRHPRGFVSYLFCIPPPGRREEKNPCCWAAETHERTTGAVATVNDERDGFPLPLTVSVSVSFRAVYGKEQGFVPFVAFVPYSTYLSVAVSRGILPGTNLFQRTTRVLQTVNVERDGFPLSPTWIVFAPLWRRLVAKSTDSGPVRSGGHCFRIVGLPTPSKESSGAQSAGTERRPELRPLWTSRESLCSSQSWQFWLSCWVLACLCSRMRSFRLSFPSCFRFRHLRSYCLFSCKATSLRKTVPKDSMMWANCE